MEFIQRCSVFSAMQVSTLKIFFTLLTTLSFSSSLVIGAKPCNYNTTAGPVAGKLNVHLVPHAHLDVGWLKTVDQCYMGSNNSIQVSSVQYVLDTLVEQLLKNPDRKFIFAEQAFFIRWWREQCWETRAKVKGLVHSGQLQFVNGGWCMHDEATTHYIDLVDQTTLGHRYIEEIFGPRAAPRIAWQIDPFGHSAVQAYLLGAEAGFDAVFFARADYADKAKRRQERSFEFVWRGSKSLGESAQIFGGLLYKHYEPPDGFNYEYKSADPPIQDDPELFDYNLDERVEAFVEAALSQAKEMRTEHVMWTMGQDYCYNYAGTWFKNMDKLIHYVNLDGRVNAFYSTPATYVDAKHAAEETWPLKVDDFFPYSDCPHCYWTGFYTSRPAFKGYVRMLSGYLQAARQLEAVVGPHARWSSAALEEALALAQHHDAVSGTEKEHVASDYARRLAKGAAGAAKMVNAALASLLVGSPPPSRPGQIHLPSLEPAAAGGARAIFSTRDDSKQNGSQTAGPTEAPLPDLHQCWLLNVSYCPPTEAPITGSHSLVVVAYNPLGWSRTEYIRIPISSDRIVVCDSRDRPVEAQLAPASSATWRLRKLSAHAHCGEASPDGPLFELTFLAVVPPLGLATYIVTAADGAGEDAVAVPATEATLADGEAGEVSVGGQHLRLTFDSASGRLTHLTNSDSGVDLALDQTYLWYNGSDGNYFDNYMQTRGTQPSGAYVFRPNSSEAFSLGETPHSPVALRIVRGPLVEEAHQQFGPWVSQVVRVYRDASHAEVEYTVGPIPIEDGLGKEIITRITTGLESDRTFYTDSNGRDYIKRVRNHRADWVLNVTEPVAGNYYPINAGIYLGDGTVELSVLPDRAVGGGSLRDGQLEVMLHRRLLYDDHRGVGAALNESVCVGDPTVCEGLTVRGRYLVHAGPRPEAARWRRRLSQRQLAPLLLAFATQDLRDATSAALVGKGRLPALLPLDHELPPNVALMTFQALQGGKYLVRLAHLFEVGEDPELSRMAQVDLAVLFSESQVERVVETTVTGNRRKDEVKPMEWRVEGESESEGESDGAGKSCVTRGRPLPEGDLVVELGPMEIRTFLVHVL